MDNLLWQLESVTLAGERADRVHAASLQIRSNVTAVIGYSGAGKTSLLNLLVGFEKPHEGQIAFHPPPRTDQGPALFWSPQDGGLWPHLKVREHLEMVAPDAGPRRGNVNNLLRDFDLADRADARPDRLSAGQRARLSIARALMTQATVLVLDEPLAHVDPGRIEKYWNRIRQHVEEGSRSLVFATHAPTAVLAHAKDAVCMDTGRVLYHGEVDALYWRPATEQLARYLGEVNWLTPDDTALWFDGLGEKLEEPACYRPEQIAISAGPNSPIVVGRRRFRGSVEDLELRHEGTGATRWFSHRPQPRPLAVGTRVFLRTCHLLIILFVIGCSASEDAELRPKAINYWPMPPDGMRIPAPRSIAVGEDGETVVLDNAGRVLILDASGKLLRHWRMPDVDVGKPEGICLLDNGRLAVADTHYHRIVFFDRDGRVLSTLGSYGEGPGQFIYPVKVITDDRANLYVAEYGGNDRIQKFSPTGESLLSFGGFSTEPGQFQRPSGLVWHAGRIYVADAINNRIQVFTDNGQFLEILEDENSPWSLKFPYDLSRGPDGLLYVIEYGTGRLTALTKAGKLVGRLGHTGRGAEQFWTPWGLTVDEDRRVLVADTGNRRIVELIQ